MKNIEKLYNEIIKVMAEDDYDITTEEVQTFAWDAADYIDMYQRDGEDYDVEQWWEDTRCEEEFVGELPHTNEYYDLYVGDED